MEAQKVLSDRGVDIKCGIGIKEIVGNCRLSKVILEDGSEIKADEVILYMGLMPNATLAKDAGILLNDKGFMIVDQYLRTNVDDIFAVGDCAEARVAALNLYHISIVRKFVGTIGIYSTSIGDSSFGVAGLTQQHAYKENFNYVASTFEGIDRHPGK